CVRVVGGAAGYFDFW
nr:immunoglobulin heavy chain junction region [Macaca mulatta]MOX67666.1 immunoglobulin heavy chain junction region [Macaca mulatta]MOX67758.1 immunoglobulin heavy chain junction region [Macaca mulatta]